MGIVHRPLEPVSVLFLRFLTGLDALEVSL